LDKTDAITPARSEAPVLLRNRGGASCFTLRPNCDMARAMNNDAFPTWCFLTLVEKC
jgi:hypothetical protein